MNRMHNKVEAGYNKAAQDYLSGRDQFESAKYLRQLDDLLPSDSTVLDIGCGSGKPVDSFLTEQGYTVTGLDISEEQIKLARKNVPKATFEVKNMSDLQYGEYAVDAVVSFYAIFHIPREEHAELLSIISSFLSSGGLLLITMGSSEWQGSEQFFGVEMHWSHYGREKNVELVQDAGFEIVLDEIDKSGGEEHQVMLAKKGKL